ncbi:MAG: sigma-70 family RNA polymerase sigma factor [Bryobacteraceae bacterium]
MERDFGEIVREHQSMVYSIALRFVRNPEAAEEMAQEVFLHLYRNLANIESDIHLTQWLRRVAVHRAIDETRRRKVRPRVGLEDAPEPSSPAEESDPLLSGILDRLVRSLPERSRAIVVMRYQEDLDPTEIARTLNMPVGTVKSHLHRTLGLLREKLAGTGRGAIKAGKSSSPQLRCASEDLGGAMKGVCE